MNQQLKTNIKRGIIILCVVLAILLIVGKNTRMKVTFATSYNRDVALDYQTAERLYKDPALEKVTGNPLVRVAIILRDYEEGYDELRSSSTGLTYQDVAKQFQRINAEGNGNIPPEDLEELRDQNRLAYQELNHQVLQAEATYFRELGAKDLQSNDSTMTIICSMRKKALANLEYGLCNYSIIFCPKDTTKINDRNIRNYAGEYSLKELVSVPLYSNDMVTENKKPVGRLIIQDDSISLEIDNYSVANCIYHKIDADTMDSRLLLQGYSPDNPIPARLLYSTKHCYEINISDNLTGYLFLTESGIYIDLGAMGLYRF